MKIYLTLLSLLYALTSYTQVLTIHVPEHHFGIDENRSLIVSHISDLKNTPNYDEYQQINLVLNENEFYFNIIPTNLSFSDAYIITKRETSQEYLLYFTELPLVHVSSNETIVDEPKRLAYFTYADSNQVITSNIGIELRGVSSLENPKKTYDIEFWTDDFGGDSKDVKFGNLRLDDDWILDGLYNEPLRLRSYTANKLWLKMHSPFYQDGEPKAKSGVDIMYVEMFLNGAYNGLYNLSEQVDRKQLKLKKFDDDIRGELYKGVFWADGVLFNALEDFDNDSRIWSGHEYRYPKEDDITDWTNLYSFTDFAIHSSDVHFNREIWSNFDKDNFADYFIFLNLIRATDNTGKNIYIGKYDIDEPYFFIPWDLDGVFGTNWKGISDNTFDDILSNGFIDRVLSLNPNNISYDIAEKWFEYRAHILSNDSLLDSITEKYQYFTQNKIYDRESIVYPNYLFDQARFSFTTTWLVNRLEYLDGYFTTITSTEPVVSNITNLANPNPVRNRIYINQDSIRDNNYTIFNSFGQLIVQGNIDGDILYVDHLTTGIYFMRIDNQIFKFIKQ